MKKIPVKLKQDPIIEALFEVRFLPKKSPIVDILPGLLFPSLGGKFPTLEKLASAHIPKEITAQDPNFLYAPIFRMHGDNYSLGLGEKVFNVSCTRPYHGWEIFKDKINQVLDVFQQIDVIDNVERFSIKYINIIPHDTDNQLNLLKSEISVGSYDMKNYLRQMRAEVKKGPFLNIIQLVTDATVNIKKINTDEEIISGLLIDVDTIYTNGISSFWDNIPELLEEAHDTEKHIFYDMLTPETIEMLCPVWE